MSKTASEILLADIKVNRNAAVPIYHQLYEQFRAMILGKRLRSGNRLPSSRILARQIGVSRVVVTQSFEQLIAEGYLIGKTGSGTFVADMIPDYLTLAKKSNTVSSVLSHMQFNLGSDYLPIEILARNSNKENVLPFQTGSPSFDNFPYKIWQQVGNKVLKKFKTFNLGYDDALGYWPLRQEIANYLRQARAVKCEADQVIVVTGSQQGLNLVTDCLLKKGDTVWMEDPGYHGAKFSFLNRGIKIHPLPIEKDGMNTVSAMKDCKEAKLVYTTPSHQFPLGGTLSLAKRLQLLNWAKRKNMWILEDDYDSEYRYEGRPLSSLQGLDTAGCVIYSGTFSKVLYPGLRLAYLIAPSLEMVNEFKKVKAMLDRQSPILDQIILSKFISEGHFFRHLRKMRILYFERQQILLGLAKDLVGNYLTIEPSAAGMNLTGYISSTINLQKFKMEIKKNNIIVPFIKDYAIETFNPRAIMLGYTAFSKYKIKTGLEKLRSCFESSLS
jgi:GntR family transcriptional regulator / MocR family aminotransferase